MEKKNGQFYRVLAIAIAVNLLFVGAFAFLKVNVKSITVSVNGKTGQMKTMKHSVDELFDSWNVSLDKEDVVFPGKNAILKNGTNVDVRLFSQKEEVVSEETDFKTENTYSSDILEGETKVVQEGVKGEDKVTYLVSYLGDEEQAREEIARETVKKPKKEIVAEGTAVSYNGVKYSRKITVVSTAYTHTGHRTATGTKPHRGTMAVDRRVIPMGSYGYVPGYGTVHAEDTGGAIKGNRIDLFFNTKGQCRSWGRRTVTLYLK